MIGRLPAQQGPQVPAPQQASAPLRVLLLPLTTFPSLGGTGLARPAGSAAAFPAGVAEGAADAAADGAADGADDPAALGAADGAALGAADGSAVGAASAVDVAVGVALPAPSGPPAGGVPLEHPTAHPSSAMERVAEIVFASSMPVPLLF
jgi:hypothetical protein